MTAGVTTASMQAPNAKFVEGDAHGAEEERLAPADPVGEGPLRTTDRP